MGYHSRLTTGARLVDFYEWVSICAAVMFGNAASFAFFMAAMKCSKLQKNGAKDDELPAWVYAGLIVPLLLALPGVYLLTP